MAYHLLLSAVLAGLALAPAATADFTYTFARISSNPYSFSFTFPTLQTGVRDPFGPLPFTVQGVTFVDSLLATVGWVGFSANADTFRCIGASCSAVGFGDTSNAMLVLSETDITGPGVYKLSFIIFNTTSLPTLERLTITEDTPPVITLTTPAADATYQQHQVVLADYTCADETGGSGVATCTGDVADGSPIDTSTVGPHSFTVIAIDHSGNETTVTHNYDVLPLDTDADGVPDAEDHCPDTPAEAIVNEHGCSIDQLCPCAQQWKNPGQYVACVDAAAADFVAAALITAADQDALVSQAAHSSCGKKK